MSNTIQTNAVKVAQETLVRLRTEFPILTKVAHRFSDGYFSGDTVKVPLVGSMGTADEWSSSTGYTPSAVTVAAVSLALDKIYHKTWSLTPFEQSAMNPSIVADMAAAAANAIGASLMADIAALVTEANFPNDTEVALTALDADKMGEIDTILASRGVANFDRYAVLGSTAFNELRKDDDVKSAAIRGDATNPVVSGQIGDVMGMFVARYPGLTSPRGWVAQKSAIALAAGLPAEQPSDGVNLTVVTDEESGLSCLVREWTDANSGEARRSIAIAAKVGKGNSTALQRIVLADSSSSSGE